MTTQKDRDGLLFYQGRASLYYPTVLVENETPHYPRALLTDLGMCKLMCAIFLIICGVVSVTTDLPFSYGSGIWTGVVVAVNGMSAITVGKKPESPIRWNILIAVTFVCELSAGLLTIFSTVGLTRSITKTSQTVQYSNQKNLLIIVYSVLLALALVDSVLSLVCFIIAIRRGIPCSTLLGRNNSPELESPPSTWQDNDSSCSSTSPIFKSQNKSVFPFPLSTYVVGKIEPVCDDVYNALDRRLAVDYLERSSKTLPHSTV